MNIAFTIPLILQSMFQLALTQVPLEDQAKVQKFTQFHLANSLCALNNFARVNAIDYQNKFGDESTLNSCATGQSGVQLLSINAALSEAAKFHAAKMAQFNEMSHDTLGESGDRKFSLRVKKFFTLSGTLGENLAKGSVFKEPIELMNSWIESPLHCKNVMDPRYNAVGFGFAEQTSFFGAQEFAAIKDFQTSGIACGSHFVKDNRIIFIASVAAASNSPILLSIGRDKFPMKAVSTSASGSIFEFDFGTLPTGCLSYHFELNGVAFPVGFELSTQGAGNCAFQLPA